MPEGISPNPLNDLSKVYLDQVAAFREIRKQETEKDIERWSQSAKDVQKEGYKGTADLSKADPEAKKKVEDRIEKWAGKRVPGGKKGVKESFSNWRTDLREISDAIPETEKKTEKEVTEKKVKNVIKINPTLPEAVAEIGGEVLAVEEGEQIDEIVGAALGTAVGANVLPGLIAKTGAKAAIGKVAGQGVAKALTGKIAGGALGAAAGEVIDPLKKQKDKNPVSAAVGGAVGTAAYPAIKGASGKLLQQSSYEPEGQELSENPIKKAWQKFVPPPEKSAEPSVRAGVRTPQTGFKHVPSYNRDGTTGQYGKKGTTAVKQGAVNAIKKVGEITGITPKGVAAAALPVAGAVGAGLAAKAVVDTVRGHGKKKEKVSEGKSRAGKYEKAGAGVGGALGGAAGVAIPDGPLMAAGELAGGYVGSKVGGKAGRQVDKFLARRRQAQAQEDYINDQIESAVEFFYEQGINEQGIDLIIEEIGLESFVDFIDQSAVELNEERAARKASVRAKKYPQVKAEVDKADAARKAAKKGEYAPSYAKKETDVTVYDDKAPAKKKAAAKKAPAGMKKAVARKKAVLQQPVKKTAPKPKVVKAVAKVKKTQPAKKPSKQGLVSKISTAYKKGLERHKAARAKGRVPEKRVKEFGKGFASGVKDTVKFAKKAKKAVVGEAYKKKKKHNCASKVKHEEYGMGNCIPEMHTLDEDGNVTHYDVMFESKIVKNIPVSSLEIIEGKFHEHYINYEKNVEVVNELFGVMGAAATKKKGTSKPQNVTFGGNKTDKRKGPVPDTKMKDYKGSPSFQKMMAKRKKVNEGKAIAENALEKRAKENEKARKWLKKDAKDSGYTDIALKASMSKGAGVSEAKVDQGRSDYGKASIRNYRRKGPGHGEPAMFDPENKRGKLIDKRREEHKARRGVKGAKVPAYKVNEDKALEMVRSAIIKKHGKGAIYDPKNPPKSSPQPKRKPEKDTRSAAQREVDAQYGRTPWNKKGSLGT